MRPARGTVRTWRCSVSYNGVEEEEEEGEIINLWEKAAAAVGEYEEEGEEEEDKEGKKWSGGWIVALHTMGRPGQRSLNFFLFLSFRPFFLYPCAQYIIFPLLLLLFPTMPTRVRLRLGK